MISINKDGKLNTSYHLKKPMKRSYILAADLGVSLVKVGIYDTSGNCIQLKTDNSPAEYPKPHIFVQSGDEYFKIVTCLIKSLMDNPHIHSADIEAIVFSGAMGGAIGIDNEWNAVTRWSTVIDNRSCNYAIDMMKTAGDEIRILSGTNFPSYSPKILWWKTEYPNVYKKISKFMFLNGFIAGKMGNLTVERAFVDRTYLQMTGIADLLKNKWSDTLCYQFGIEKNKLPNIVRSKTIIGKLCKTVAQNCGLIDGIPLIAGAGDKPAGYVGAGIATPGLLIDEAASFAAFSLCTDRYVPDRNHRTLENIPSPISGQYYPTIYLIGSGTTHTWFKNTFGDEEKRIAAETGKSEYDILDEKAKNIAPGSDGLLAIGLLGGRVTPCDPDIKGMWLGFSWNHKKEHFYRSLLESFAYEYAHSLNVMKENYPDLKLHEVRVIGGGARSDLWNQIKSDVLGLPYKKLDRDDFTLLGDVLIAGNAIGIYDDLAEIAQSFAKGRKYYYPDEDNYLQYQEFTKAYGNTFDRVRDIFLNLKKIPHSK